MIVSLLSSIIYSTQAISVPVPTLPFAIEQPDGKKFMAVRWGDEFQSGYKDLDGYSIVLNEETGYWYYTTNDEACELIVSSLRVDADISEGIKQRTLKKHACIGNKTQKTVNDLPKKTIVGNKPNYRTPFAGSFDFWLLIIPVLLIWKRYTYKRQTK